MSQAQDPPGPSTEPSGDPARGSKRRAPSWSGPELKTLLELWGEEEALQALKSRRRNANIYGRMAEALAQKGHYPRTQDQVRSKVKELRQGYVKAREESSHSGAVPYYCPYYSELDQILGGSGEARTPRQFVQSGLADPVVDAPEEDPEQSGDGDMVPEEEDSAETATLTLEPVTQTPEASQVSSGAGEEAAAGPAVQEGRSTPAPPPSRGHGSRRHRRVYADILRQHMEAVQELNSILRERAEAEDRWRDRLMEELVQQRTSLTATLREVCGLPAPVPGPAPPAPHDSAPQTLLPQQHPFPPLDLPLPQPPQFPSPSLPMALLSPRPPCPKSTPASQPTGAPPDPVAMVDPEHEAQAGEGNQASTVQPDPLPPLQVSSPLPPLQVSSPLPPLQVSSTPITPVKSQRKGSTRCLLYIVLSTSKMSKLFLCLQQLYYFLRDI
ncbi:uncharacterized protein LOC142830019 [Pelodiscus sinensis]|uniref:uncharacterized protein LOC142830019 n=1 Tax=Pelodiscus sinensis TaxID=13735 RepID=UPI003F6C342E